MAFPSVTLLSSLVTGAEAVLGAPFALITGAKTTGKTTSQGWRAGTAFGSGLTWDAAYYTTTSYGAPAVAMGPIKVVVGNEARRYELYACLQNPGTEETGYVLRIICNTAGTQAEYNLYKAVKGVRTLLKTVTVSIPAVGDSFGLTVKAGIVSAWRKKGAGEWEVVNEASDTTYLSGFIGFGMDGNLGRVENISAGEQVVAHEHTLAVTQPSSFVGRPFENPTSGAVPVIETFNKAAGVLTGPWALLPGAKRIGKVEGEKWKAESIFGEGEDGAYYTGSDFASPVLIAEATWALTKERYLALYACLQSPGGGKLNGYRLHIEQTVESPKQYKLRLQKLVEGAPSTLAEATLESEAPPTFIALSVINGVLKAYTRTTGGEAWTQRVEASDSTWSTGSVGIGAKGNTGTLDTLQALAGQLNPLREVARVLKVTQGQTATKIASKPHSQSATQASALTFTKALAKAFVLTQAQAISRTATPSKAFTLTQASSFGPQVPSTPLTDELESEAGFNAGATWTVLAWAEAIGIVYQKNKGLTKTQKPTGWGGTELKKLGARYNVAAFTDPINYMVVREDDDSAAGRLAAIGICVPASGERSGYVGRIEATAAGAAYAVTLERWVNGVKTILAETTIASNFFGTAKTEKNAPFVLTLVGGVLRLWLGPVKGFFPEGTPTSVLLTATDTTFTSGYNTMESVGSWMLSLEHAASMDGQIVLEGHPSKGHTQEATQGSSATRGATQVLRTLAVGQASSPSFGRQIARSLTATQAATQTVSRAVAHSFATAQGQSISKRTGIARTLSLGITQVASKAVGLARSLSVTQGQSATEHGGLTRTLVGTQGSTATERASVTRTLIGTQAQAATRQTALARAMVAASGASATFVRAVARALRVGQPQTASQEGSIEGGVHDHPHTLGAGQGASAALQRALARRLTAGATVSASVAHSATRTLAASGGATARVGRSLPITLSGSSSSTAALQRTQVGLVLSAMSSSGASVRRAIARGLSTTTGSAAAVSFDTTEVPLPPPVNMAASSGMPQPTSEAVTPQGEASLGQSRLTSSVETSK